MSALKKREVDLIAESLAEQGMRVRKTQDGYFFYCERSRWGTSLHYTESDWRGVTNTRKRLERHGYIWPLGKKGRRDVRASR